MIPDAGVTSGAPNYSVSGGYSISISIYPPPRKITTDG